MPLPPQADNGAGRNPAARHTGWRTPLCLFAIAVICWCALAGTYFFRMWLLEKLWILAVVPLGTAWLGAITASVIAVFVLARRGSELVAIGVAVVSVVLAVGVLVTDWRHVYAHVWFATHEAEFTTAQQMARSGELGSPELWKFSDVELPPELRTLSVNGKIDAIGTAGGEPVLFLPAYIEIPDDSCGFAHLNGPPETGLDGFGDPVHPRIDLGGGWWWVD
jgi:hypothetical protein